MYLSTKNEPIKMAFFSERQVEDLYAVVQKQYQHVAADLLCIDCFPGPSDMLANSMGEYGGASPFYEIICDRVAEQLYEENPGKFPDPETYAAHEHYVSVVGDIVHAFWDKNQPRIIRDIETVLLDLQMSFAHPSSETVINCPIVKVW